MSDGAGERLILLFVVGAVLINFPVLAIFNRDATIAGFPTLYLYLFSVWAVGIVVVFLLVRRS
jgi:hypothetical protein